MFETASLPQAALIIASGIPLKKTEHRPNGRMVFGFDDPKARALAGKYASGVIVRMSPLRFMQAFDDLRDILKSGVRHE
ncbi:MAG: hypothetical protein WCK47_13685 [bacterium]